MHDNTVWLQHAGRVRESELHARKQAPHREAGALNSALGSWISFSRNEELLKTFGNESKMLSTGIWKNDPHMWRVSFRQRNK